jgi:hypothetical protein
MDSLPHQHKILIAGNHDLPFDGEHYLETWRRWHPKAVKENPTVIRNLILSKKSITYLEDSAIELPNIVGKSSLKIYGSPWQPEFGGWAFNMQRGPQFLGQIWKSIPDTTDILITHGPPAKYNGMSCGFPKRKKIVEGDQSKTESPQLETVWKDVGCEDLLKRVEVVKPAVHIFGHIHESYGSAKNEHTTFVNASNCSRGKPYKAENRPIVVDIEPIQ